jgi:hypothetical protein
VGLMIGLCVCLNKPNLSDRIYVRFMGSKWVIVIVKIQSVIIMTLKIG